MADSKSTNPAPKSVPDNSHVYLRWFEILQEFGEANAHATFDDGFIHEVEIEIGANRANWEYVYRVPRDRLVAR